MCTKWKILKVERKRIGSAFMLVLVTVFLLFYNWTNEAIKTAHIMPIEPQINIVNLVKETGLSNQKLRILSEQTGVNENIIETLLEQGQWQQLLELQEAYYAPIKIKSIRTTPLTICEYMIDENGNRTKGMAFADIQDGDILITKNSRFLGWRNGHAGLVVDAKQGVVLEAVMLGTNTTLCQLEEWEKYPSFIVLRLNEELGETYDIEQVVTYAKQNLVAIPYKLHAGLWEKITGIFRSKNTDLQEGQVIEVAEAALSGTHCAHLIWYAYKKIGIDLDSDGGFFVTPYDIQNSPYLEVIQTYGY